MQFQRFHKLAQPQRFRQKPRSFSLFAALSCLRRGVIEHAFLKACADLRAEGAVLFAERDCLRYLLGKHIIMRRSEQRGQKFALHVRCRKYLREHF